MRQGMTFPALVRAGGLGLLCSLSVLATGCGKNAGVASMVEGIEVRTYENAGDLWAELKAQLSTGALILSGLNLPILDPKNPGAVYGNLAVNSTFCGSASCGGSQLTVQLNVSKITHTSALSPLLPNGTSIPVGGLESTTIVALPVGNTGARIYVGIGSNVALLGFALPFKEFDKIGTYVPGINLFQPFGQGTDSVHGVVGLFTGAGAGQNGMALFIDMSGLLKPTTVAPMLASGATARIASSVRVNAAAAMAVAVEPAGELVFYETKPSRWEEQQLYYQLDRLNRKRSRLNVR